MNKQKSLNVESNMKSKAANAEKGPNTVNSDVISPKTVCMPKGLNALFPTALSFKTTSIILVILRKTIIFAHSDAGSTASGVSFYRSYKIIFVGGNQMRQRSFFDFRLNFRYAKIRFILLICNILHV